LPGQLLGIERQVGVGRHRRHVQHVITGVEVDGLGADKDEVIEVVMKCAERVE
jgi:hypothetical protein